MSTGYRIQFRCRPPVHAGVRHTIIHNPHQSEALAHEVQMLLHKGAMELVDPQVHLGGFFSIYFPVTKKDGGFRPILDLRNLNRFLKFLPFRMLRTTNVLQAFMLQDWFMTIDLKDTSFHIPEHR